VRLSVRREGAKSIRCLNRNKRGCGLLRTSALPAVALREQARFHFPGSFTLAELVRDGAIHYRGSVAERHVSTGAEGDESGCHRALSMAPKTENADIGLAEPAGPITAKVRPDWEREVLACTSRVLVFFERRGPRVVHVRDAEIIFFIVFFTTGRATPIELHGDTDFVVLCCADSCWSVERSVEASD